MNHVRSIASCFVALSCLVVACGADDDDDGGTGGSSGKGGSAGSAGKGGTSSAGKGGTGGTSSAGKGGTGGTSSAGKGGTGGSSAGTAGSGGSSAGTGGSNTSGTGGTAVGGEGGNDTGGQGGEAGAYAGAAGAPEGGMGGEAGTAGMGGAGGDDAGNAGAGGAGGEPIVPDTIDNPGFEQGTENGSLPTNWLGTGTVSAAKYNWDNTGGARTGTGFLDLWASSAYTVDVSQVVSPLPDGSYTLRIWYRGIAYTSQHIYVTGYNEANPTAETTQVTTPAGNTYAELVIANIPVTNGQIKIGIHSVAPANAWSNFDDVSLTLNP